MNLKVSASYFFKAQTAVEIAQLQEKMEAFAQATGLRGLMLLGAEGINGTVCATSDTIESWKQLIHQMVSEKVEFKDSWVEKFPFNEFKIKIKKEIVTIGRPNLVPPAQSFHHLSPQEWHEALQDPDTVVIDTRNDYEVEIGKFKTAIDFKIDEFTEFPKKLEESGLSKDKKVLIYCTGGIRCEKAILAMHEQGFKNVGQLQGGILNYLAEYPNEQFEGECFVFDYRVAVDQNLAPSKRYSLCPHCGQPAEQKIECIQCGTEEVVCKHCVEKGGSRLTCSKNCAHHHEIGSRSRKRHVAEYNRRHRVNDHAE